MAAMIGRQRLRGSVSLLWYIRCAVVVMGLVAMTAWRVYAGEEVIYYHNDTLGSPVAATDEQGNRLWQQEYQPYGERLLQQGSGQNTLWYTGKPEESDLGISYFGARWYDPSLGRFLAVDPAGFTLNNLHSFNKYVYANNHPYLFVDPDGYEPINNYAPMPTHGTYRHEINDRRLENSEYAYSYITSYPIGRVSDGITAREAMAYLQSNPDAVFPFTVNPKDGGSNSIRLGGQYKLDNIRHPFDKGNGVLVDDVTGFTFRFETDSTHFDKAGSTIRFSTYEKDGIVYLEHTAFGVASSPLMAKIAKIGALSFAWPKQAESLSRQLYRQRGFTHSPYARPNPYATRRY